MADAKPKAGKPSNPWHDVLWFFGILAMFFFLWVWGGGPERARKNPPSPVLNNSTNIAPTPRQSPSPASSGVNNPSRPSSSTPNQVTPSQGSGSGQIQVTPI